MQTPHAHPCPTAPQALASVEDILRSVDDLALRMGQEIRGRIQQATGPLDSVVKMVSQATARWLGGHCNAAQSYRGSFPRGRAVAQCPRGSAAKLSRLRALHRPSQIGDISERAHTIQEHYEPMVAKFQNYAYIVSATGGPQ
jgi:hypothetical protein